MRSLVCRVGGKHAVVKEKDNDRIHRPWDTKRGTSRRCVVDCVVDCFLDFPRNILKRPALRVGRLCGGEEAARRRCPACLLNLFRKILHSGRKCLCKETVLEFVSTGRLRNCGPHCPILWEMSVVDLSLDSPNHQLHASCTDPELRGPPLDVSLHGVLKVSLCRKAHLLISVRGTDMIDTEERGSGFCGRTWSVNTQNFIYCSTI